MVSTAKQDKIKAELTYKMLLDGKGKKVFSA
jgi:hypothetical protein